MNLKGIMPSERKVMCSIFPFIWHSQTGKTQAMKNKSVVARAQSSGGGGHIKADEGGSSRVLYGDTLRDLLCILMVMVGKWVHVC